MRQGGARGAQDGLPGLWRGALSVTDTVDMGGPVMGDAERSAVDRVLRSGRLAQGPEVEAFERELATDLAGGRHAVALASGTAALDLSLLARSEEHTSELQSRGHLVCRLLLEKK